MWAKVGGDGGHHGRAEHAQTDSAAVSTVDEGAEGADSRVRPDPRVHAQPRQLGCCASWGKTVFSHHGGQLVKIVVGRGRARRSVPRVYDQQVYEALEKIWYLYGGMCGRRLSGVLRHQMPLNDGIESLPWKPTESCAT